MEEVKTCEFCREQYPNDKFRDIQGVSLCRDCVELFRAHGDIVRCTECGTLIWDNLALYDEGEPYCDDCMDAPLYRDDK